MMAWLNSPQMAKHARAWASNFVSNTIFPAKLSEIAILVTARTGPRITNGMPTSDWR